ncbi:MAG: flagellar basal-body MS-ring/collar protein FliF [Thermodesulfobacteriota bacterium]|nr:flagellar basal-body MS-ring/collar protein FliF [Thermodesulfobacteriota bacterium]
MLESLGSTFGQMRAVFSQMPPARKVMILAGFAAVVTCFIVLLVWTNKTDFEVVYSGLSQEDAGAIVAKLKERKTPFRITADGSVVMVPREAVQEARLYLATEGLPAGGAVGMELFNTTSIGATSFVQRLNYQRALQGELARTIKKFREVDQVRVHLNIPKESLFVEEKREPAASVVLKLHAGRSLSRSQLEGIVHLVAGSVEGLNSKNISIVDTKGGLLYSQEEEAGGGLLTAKQIQHRRNMEQGLADRITTMLERVVGPDKALTRVTADLNFQQISTSEEVYDPDRSVIRSEQRFTEKTTGQARGASGVPNARYDLGSTEQGVAASGSDQETYEKSEETTNYEITRINRRIVTPGGEVKRLSVAVIVDGTYKETEKDGETVQTFVPRGQAELAKLENLVRNAVGFVEERGDTVAVTSVPFFLAQDEEGLDWMATIWDYLRQLGRPALNILLIVLFFLLVVRPFMAWLQREAKVELPPPPEKEALAEAEEKTLPGPKVEDGKLTRDQVMALAQQDPDRTVNLIRRWVDER